MNMDQVNKTLRKTRKFYIRSYHTKGHLHRENSG
jgi:hypothetical protein